MATNETLRNVRNWICIEKEWTPCTAYTPGYTCIDYPTWRLIVHLLADGARSILSSVNVSSFSATQYPSTSVSYVGIIVTSKVKIKFKETVQRNLKSSLKRLYNVISTDPPCKDGNVRFTLVPLQLRLIKYN